jgi:serine protease inhibitor ecotin
MKKLNLELFIEKAREKHGHKYNYDLVDYVNAKTKVIITCPIHGNFEQLPTDHLKVQIGCSKCSNKIKLTNKTFIEKAREKHGHKYNYDLVDYINNYTKVIISCPIHGNFNQQAKCHLSGKGCFACSGKTPLTNETFIEKAREKHGHKYNYDLVDYIGNKTKVIISCPIHGSFSQSPNNHISKKAGCPKCNSSKGEMLIYNYLLEKHIQFIEQKRFKELGNQSFDFFLPEHNILVEFQGEQHYEPVRFGGISEHNAKKFFEKQQKLDNRKKDFCHKYGYILIEIRYDEEPEYILNDYFREKIYE